MQETRESLDGLASFRNTVAHAGSIGLEDVIAVSRRVFSGTLLEHLIAAGEFEG